MEKLIPLMVAIPLGGGFLCPLVGKFVRSRWVVELLAPADLFRVHESGDEHGHRSDVEPSGETSKGAAPGDAREHLVLERRQLLGERSHPPSAAQDLIQGRLEAEARTGLSREEFESDRQVHLHLPDQLTSLRPSTPHPWA